MVATERSQAAPPEPPEEPVETPAPVDPPEPEVTPNLGTEDVPEPTDDVIEGSYVVVMAADPVVAYTGEQPGLEATAVPPGEDLEPSDPAVQKYVAFLEQEQAEALARAGVSEDVRGQTYTYAISGFEAELTEAQAERLEHQPQVAKVVPNRLRQLTTDNTPDFLGLTASNGPWAAGYTGEDVVVGVIDTGI